MITIEHPSIILKKGEAFLQAVLNDDKRNKQILVWYSVQEHYGTFLCDDRADAFLIVALMYAMKSHQDIAVEAPVSKRLLFNIENVIQPLFSKMIPGSRCITISVQGGSCPILDGKAVGCGCSLGVDSLSALYKHMSDHMMEEYRVSHLALFNSCQLGYLNPELDESAFREAVESLAPFSKEVNLPVVAVNSNLNVFYAEAGFTTASSRFFISTLSCVLALQKLFGKYVFASSCPVDSFELSQKDQSHAEAAYVPLLSTESTEIILSGSTLTRVEKTDQIRHNHLTQRYLDVCWATQVASSISHDDRWLKEKTKKNCGWCDKCLRTLFTLELLGEDLQRYGELFDLSKYYSHKGAFVKTVILNRHKKHMYMEVYNLMSEKNYIIPRSVLFSVWMSRIKRMAKKILRFFNL